MKTSLPMHHDSFAMKFAHFMHAVETFLIRLSHKLF